MKTAEEFAWDCQDLLECLVGHDYELAAKHMDRLNVALRALHCVSPKEYRLMWGVVAELHRMWRETMR